jgi:hypothetical protein
LKLTWEIFQSFHQSQATLPGLTQEMSFNLEGEASFEPYRYSGDLYLFHDDGHAPEIAVVHFRNIGSSFGNHIQSAMSPGFFRG